MKKDRKEQIRRIEQAFVAAHRGREEPPPGDAFARRVMMDVRRMGNQSFEPSMNGGVSRSVWAFAAASCCLALFISVWALSADFSAIQYQVAQMFVGDPSDLLLAEAFAVI